MAGPIGIAVVHALIKLRCPHCGHVQARARSSHCKYRVCSRCHKHFDEPPKKPPARRR